MRKPPPELILKRKWIDDANPYVHKVLRVSSNDDQIMFNSSGRDEQVSQGLWVRHVKPCSTDCYCTIQRQNFSSELPKDSVFEPFSKPLPLDFITAADSTYPYFDLVNRNGAQI